MNASLPASPADRWRCSHCRGATCLLGSDRLKRSLPSRRSGTSNTKSESLQKFSVVRCVFLYHRWCVCTSWCLTRSISSHVIPEMDALCLGISRVNRGDEDCGFTGRKDVSCSAGHHVEACTAHRAGKAHTPPFCITQHHIRLPWWTFPHP